jgi:hypothetical protein
MPFRSTAAKDVAKDDDFVAVTRRRFSPLAAVAVLFFAAQLTSVAVALVSLRADNPAGSASYEIDRAHTSSTADSGSAHALHAGGCRIIGQDAAAVPLDRLVR